MYTGRWPWPEAQVSAAAFRISRVGRQSRDTLADPAMVCAPPLALLLLCVLAQQGSHLLLVIKRTGTETGPQPGSVLGTARHNENLRFKLNDVTAYNGAH